MTSINPDVVDRLIRHLCDADAHTTRRRVPARAHYIVAPFYPGYNCGYRLFAPPEKDGGPRTAIAYWRTDTDEDDQ